MKPNKLAFVFLLASATCWGQLQEILRPTVDIDGAASTSIALDSADCTNATYSPSVGQPNWYDNGGLSTSTTFNLTNSNTSFTLCSARVFKTWGTTTNTYSQLTLNVNTAGSCLQDCGKGTLAYSTNGGSTWTQIRQSTGWAQVTDTITLSPSQDLTQLRVAANDWADLNDVNGLGLGQFQIRGFDTWTVGTYAAATPTPTPNLPNQTPAVAHPIIISKNAQHSFRTWLTGRLW